MKKSMTVSQKTTKRALWMNVLSLVLCFTMLVSTTFAWFTDSVTSGKNQIIAGNLDIELLHTSASVKTAESVQDQTNLFRDVDGEAMKWEPGAMSYETFTIQNTGDMALSYKLAMNLSDYNALNGHTLKEVLKIKVLVGQAQLADITRETALAMDWTADTYTPETFQKTGSLQSGASETFQVVVYWQPTDDDNLYNVNNGKKSSDENQLFIDFGINVVATQRDQESDSFGTDYDKNLVLPDLPANINKSFTSAPIDTATTFGESGSVTVANQSTEENVATIPRAAVNAVVSRLLNQAADKAEDSEPSAVISLNVATNEKTSSTVTYDIGFSAELSYKGTDGADKTTTLNSLNGSMGDEIVTTVLSIGRGLAEVSVTHKAEPMQKLVNESTEDEGYWYNGETGTLTIKTRSFSPFTVDFSYDAVCCIGETPYATLEEAVAAYQPGEVIYMLKDVEYATIDGDVTITSGGAGLIASVGVGHTATIRDGNFSFWNQCSLSAFEWGGHFVISGGTFGTEVWDSETAENYVPVKVGDVWTVVPHVHVYTETEHDTFKNLSCTNYSYACTAPVVISETESCACSISVLDSAAVQNGAVAKLTVRGGASGGMGGGESSCYVKSLETAINFVSEYNQKNSNPGGGHGGGGHGDGPSITVIGNMDNQQWILNNGWSWPSSITLGAGTITCDAASTADGHAVILASGGLTGSLQLKANETVDGIIKNKDTVSEDAAVVRIDGDCGGYSISLKGGTYCGTYAVIAESGTVTVDGATLQGKVKIGPGAALNVTDGTIEGDIELASGAALTVRRGELNGRLIVAEGATVTITGGTFASSQVKDYLQSGYVCLEEEDGYVIKSESDIEAEQMLAKASACIGQPVAALRAAVGDPESRSYDRGKLTDYEEGQWVYNAYGFSVWTQRPTGDESEDNEYVQSVSVIGAK